MDNFRAFISDTVKNRSISVKKPSWFEASEDFKSLPAPRENCSFGAREQAMEASFYLDANNIYGSDVETVGQRRTFQSG